MRVILITGTPGTGKTIISRRLSNKIDAKCISLNELATSENFSEDYDEDRDTYITNTEKLTLHLKILLSRAKKDNVKNVIIEGHFADIVPNKFIDIVFVLRCHPDILKERLEERNYKGEKVKENLQAEILGNSANYILHKELQCPIYEIDTSNKPIKQNLKTIFKLFKGIYVDKHYKFGRIDWLEFLSETNRLNEFFD